MDLRLICDGFAMDLRWICGGFATDLRWICDGVVTDLRRICDGFAMDLRYGVFWPRQTCVAILHPPFRNGKLRGSDSAFQVGKSRRFVRFVLAGLWGVAARLCVGSFCHMQWLCGCVSMFWRAFWCPGDQFWRAFRCPFRALGSVGPHLDSRVGPGAKPGICWPIWAAKRSPF